MICVVFLKTLYYNVKSYGTAPSARNKSFVCTPCMGQTDHDHTVYEGGELMEIRKTDRRVKHTQALLQHSLIKLMQEKPLIKITVTDICNLADINRSTFYLHYTDPLSLLHAIETELLEDVIDLIRVPDKDFSFTSFIHTLLKALDENKETSTIFLKCHDGHLFSNSFFESFHDCFISMLNRTLPAASSSCNEYHYTFVANGLISVVRKWIADGFFEEPREIEELLETVCSCALIKKQCIL